MKILVISDSHGSKHNIKRVLDLHPDADALFHLGDGTADLSSLNGLPPAVFTVNGNHEDGLFSSKKGFAETAAEVGGKRFFLCHGHRLGVSFGMQNLIYKALESDADVVLFGHTHRKCLTYIPEGSAAGQNKGFYIFNPGSVSRPRDSIYGSFGLIEIKNNGILLSHGSIV